jgi:hypothetical protein
MPMPTKSAKHDQRRPRTDEAKPLQPWQNTKPRGNPELDARDLNRSIERFEMLLGRSGLGGGRVCRREDGPCWARTSDLRLVEPALSQLS